MRMKLLGILVALALLVGGLAGAASAQSFRAADSVSLGADETVDSSAWLTGSTINVAGTVNGDLYCAGQNVTVSGTVNGDVICAGQTITVTGTVNGDVRLAGQTTTIGGTVMGDASAVGQVLLIETKGVVKRDLAFAGQHAGLSGVVGRDMVAAADSITLDSSVGRNVTAQVMQLTLKDTALVGGDVNYTSPQRAAIDEGAQISGKVAYVHKEMNNGEVVSGMIVAYIAFMLFLALILYTSALLFSLLFPGLLRRVTDPTLAAPSQAGIALLVGLGATFLMPLVLFVLGLTIVGLPLAIVLAIGWLLIVSVSGAFTAFYLGRLVWHSVGNAVAAMAIGALLLIVLMLLPVIGIFVAMLSLWYGTGAMLMELKRDYGMPKYTLKRTR